MSPLDSLDEEVDELVESFMSQAIVGDLDIGITQYLVYFAIAMVIVLVLLVAFKKRQSQSLVPQGVFVNGIEMVVEFVRDDICKQVLGDSWRKHFPFLATLFFTILVNNIVGLIPGLKPGTGTISVTGALALCSFVYFIYCGVKKRGGWGYIKSLAPAGVPFPINVVVWLIEVLSTFLRLITLAVRLFCNMFAGHMVMGTFAILASLFVEPLLEAFSLAALGEAATSIFWEILLIVIYVLEILVACIQAYIFTLLSAVYIQTAESDE